MGTTTRISLILFALFALVSSASATWAIPFGYQNAVNVSVNSWHYVQSYIGSNAVFAGPTVNFAMAKLPNTITGPVLVQGFSSAGVNLGNITFYPVSQPGGSPVILLSNKTIYGSEWAFASVFYNTSRFVSFNESIDTLNQTVQQSGVVQSLFTHMNYFTGNSMLFTMGGTTSQFGSEVLLSTNSLMSEIFHANYSPDAFTRYSIYPNNGAISSNAEVLDSLGLPIPLLTSNSNVTGKFLPSKTAQEVFGATFNGFEAYFALTGNQTVTSNMIASKTTGRIYNATANVPVFRTLLQTPGFVQMQINTSDRISFILLPGFTTNVVVSNTIAMQTNFTQPLCFIYTIPVKNVSYTSNFITYAEPGYQGEPYNVSLTADFLKLVLPHKSEMGFTCSGIYLYDTNSTGLFAGGEIPYTLLNCSSANATLLVSNKSVNGFTFNSFYAYYGLGSNYYPMSYSVPGPYASWMIYRNEVGSFSIDPSSEKVPFLATLNVSLNTNSIISLGNTVSANTLYSYNGIGYHIWLTSGAGPGLLTGGDTKIVFPISPYGAVYDAYATDFTAVETNTLTGSEVSNLTTTATRTTTGGSAFFNLNSGVAATLTKLYSTTYSVKPPQPAPAFPVCGNLTQNNGGSPTNFTVTPITIINGAPTNTVATTALAFFPSVEFPTFFVSLIALIGIGVIAAIGGEDSPINIVAGFIVLFFFGFLTFGNSVVILASVLLIVMAFWEFGGKDRARRFLA